MVAGSSRVASRQPSRRRINPCRRNHPDADRADGDHRCMLRKGFRHVRGRGTVAAITFVPNSSAATLQIQGPGKAPDLVGGFEAAEACDVKRKRE